MKCIYKQTDGQIRRVLGLFACLFALSCLAMVGCGSSQGSASTRGFGIDAQQTSKESSRTEIRDVNDVPDALTEAMKEVKGCKMTLEPDSSDYCYLYEDSDRVGAVELSEDADSFTVYIDSDRSGENSDRALERVAHMTLASVLACNPDYDYSKAQDVAVKIIEADDEYRDGKISYKAGTKSYQYVLLVYL